MWIAGDVSGKTRSNDDPNDDDAGDERDRESNLNS
jgi:hypothetical protein